MSVPASAGCSPWSTSSAGRSKHTAPPADGEMLVHCTKGRVRQGRLEAFAGLTTTGGGGGEPPPPLGPHPLDADFIVGKKEISKRKYRFGPFMVHKLLGSRSPPSF